METTQNPDVAALLDGLDLVSQTLVGLRNSLVDGGYTEPAAEQLCLMFASANLFTPAQEPDE